MRLRILLAGLLAAAAIAAVPASAAARGCSTPLSVKRHAYDVKVYGGLSCRSAKRALKAFVATGASPSGYFCARLSRAQTGSDFTCESKAHPTRRTTARRVREV